MEGAWWGVAIILTLAIVGAAACALGSRPRTRERYSASVAATGMGVPTVAAVLMSAAYLGPWFPWLHAHAVLVGTLSSLAGWFVVALPLCRFATAERASPRTFGELKVRLDRLGAILDAIRPGAAADLAVALIAAPQRTQAPGGIVYIVAVRNLGPADATGVAVSLRIAGDVAVVAPRAARDAWSRVITSGAPAQSITYRCHQMAAGAVVTFREEVRASPSGPVAQTIAADVEASSGSLDTNPRNDATDALLTPLPASSAPETGLHLDVLAACEEVAPGGALTYAVVLTNDSANEARDVRLAIDLPPNAALSHAEADTDGWSFSGTGGQLASLGAGQATVVLLTVTLGGAAPAAAEVAPAFRLAGIVDGSQVERTCSARCAVTDRADDALTHGQETALCVARRQYEQAWRSLTEPPDNVGWRWIMASGYITAWNQVHRAEEALLELLPIHELVGEAFQFGLRLRDSNVGSANDLLDILRRALTVVSPAAASLIPGQVSAPGSSAGADPPLGSTRVAEARTVIRQVVRTVNEFRDSSRDGLLRARGQLMRDVAFAGLTTYVLMCIAVVLGVPQEGLLAALAYYFVGAVVGLFNRLYLDSSADTAIEEDYGLSIVRLIETPLFSGLAALGGVLVTAMLPLALNGSVVTPHAATPAEVVASATPSSALAATASATLSSSATPIATPAPAAIAAPAAPAQPVPLADIFSIQRYPFGIIMAAIFGLTPTLLISRLSQPVEKYKSDLKSTEASQH